MAGAIEESKGNVFHHGTTQAGCQCTKVVDALANCCGHKFGTDLGLLFSGTRNPPQQPSRARVLQPSYDGAAERGGRSIKSVKRKATHQDDAAEEEEEAGTELGVPQTVHTGEP